MRNKRTTDAPAQLLTTILVATLLFLAVLWLTSCAGSGKSGGRPPSPKGEATAPAQPQPPPDTATAPIVTPPDPPLGDGGTPRPVFAALVSYPQPHPETALNIRDHGVHPNNSPEQNSDAIEFFFNTIPVGYTPAVWAPLGDYHFARAIVIDSRPIHFFGDSGSPWALGTRFYFPPGVNGIQVLRSAGYQGGIVQNIATIGQPNSATWASGFVVRARAKIIGCSAKGFSHNGIDFYANIEAEGTDASGSLVFDCVALENAHDGFYAGRMDANAISFIVCDARDNGRYGFNDDSFLGNWFEKCMAHYNKGGDFFVRDKLNARSTFRDCYSEGGNTPSSLGTLSTVSGGLWGSGYTQ